MSSIAARTASTRFLKWKINLQATRPHHDGGIQTLTLYLWLLPCIYERSIASMTVVLCLRAFLSIYDRSLVSMTGPIYLWAFPCIREPIACIREPIPCIREPIPNIRGWILCIPEPTPCMREPIHFIREPIPCINGPFPLMIYLLIFCVFSSCKKSDLF